MTSVRVNSLIGAGPFEIKRIKIFRPGRRDSESPQGLGLNSSREPGDESYYQTQWFDFCLAEAQTRLDRTRYYIYFYFSRVTTRWIVGETIFIAENLSEP